MALVAPPWVLRLAAQGAAVASPRTAEELGLRAIDLAAGCHAALDAPIGSPPLRDLAEARGRIVVLISDATRDEPRDAMVHAILQHLRGIRYQSLTLVVASGTHASRPPDGLVSAALLGALPCLVHDGSDADAVVELGHTPRGTRVRIHRALVGADLVISTGRIRPHYFAGFSGGAKSIFPGCAKSEDARQNHLWKAHPSARLGALTSPTT